MSGDYIPKLRRRKAGGSVVTLGGRDYYCGAYGSAAATARYDGLVRRWLADGRRPPPRPRDRAAGATAADLCRRYREYARGYYRASYKPMESSIRAVETMAADLPAGEFGPAELRAVRQGFIDRGCTLATVNKVASRVRSMFRWGVAEGLVPVTAWQALTAVPGIRAGRGIVREGARRGPAAAGDVAAVLADRRLPAAVAGLIRLQMATGMRPGEACRMRAGDVDRSAEPWAYRPAGHKGAWMGREKVVYLGPRARAVLAPLVAASPRPDAPLFGTRGGIPYPPGRYARSVAAACRRAGCARWSPHQLRKARAQQVREAEGPEAAALAIGDDVATALKHYCTRNDPLARGVAERSG